jgi:hypothetical protein
MLVKVTQFSESDQPLSTYDPAILVITSIDRKIERSKDEKVER